MMKWQDRAKAELKKQKLSQDVLIGVLGVTTRGAIGHYLSEGRYCRHNLFGTSSLIALESL